MDKVGNLMIKDVKQLYLDIRGLPVKSAIRVASKFRDKHGLTDKEAIRAQVVGRILVEGGG